MLQRHRRLLWRFSSKGLQAKIHERIGERCIDDRHDLHGKELKTPCKLPRQSGSASSCWKWDRMWKTHQTWSFRKHMAFTVMVAVHYATAQQFFPCEECLSQALRDEQGTKIHISVTLSVPPKSSLLLQQAEQAVQLGSTWTTPCHSHWPPRQTCSRIAWLPEMYGKDSWWAVDHPVWINVYWSGEWWSAFLGLICLTDSNLPHMT